MYRWTVLLEHFLNWLKLKCVLSKNWEKVRYLSFFCFLIEHNIGEGCLNCTSLDIGDCQGILFSFLNKELSIAQNGLKYGNIFIFNHDCMKNSSCSSLLAYYTILLSYNKVYFSQIAWNDGVFNPHPFPLFTVKHDKQKEKDPFSILYQSVWWFCFKKFYHIICLKFSRIYHLENFVHCWYVIKSMLCCLVGSSACICCPAKKACCGVGPCLWPWRCDSSRG